MSKKELAYAYFTYHFQEKRYQTLVHHANYHPRAKEQAFKRCASLHFIHSPRENTKKAFAQERDNKNAQEGANFSQVLLIMGELCYEMRFT
jgi:hypothetical protein